MNTQNGYTLSINWKSALTLFVSALISNQAFAKVERASCTLELETTTNKLAQEPLKSSKKIAMTMNDEIIRNPRHQFDLTGTDFQCEVSFSGFGFGTFLNCWNGDQSLGMQVDRTQIKSPNEHSVVNTLTISKATSRSKIKFWCEK